MKHHPDICAANTSHRLFVERKQVLPVVLDGFRCARRLSGRQEAQQREHGGRLAAAALANERQHFSARE